MTTFVNGTEFVVINCGYRGGGCGIEFAVTREFYDHIRSTGAGWHCPNGHGRAFSGPSDASKLRDAEARLKATEDQLSAAIRDAETQRQERLRVQSRISHGVCPCCNRSFKAVREHMASQHPEYVKSLPETKSYRCACGRRFDTFAGLRRHQTAQRGDGWDKPNVSGWRSHLTVV